MWRGTPYLTVHVIYCLVRKIVADQESRISNLDSEWALANFVFSIIVGHFGTPAIRITNILKRLLLQFLA